MPKFSIHVNVHLLPKRNELINRNLMWTTMRRWDAPQKMKHLNFDKLSLYGWPLPRHVYIEDEAITVPNAEKQMTEAVRQNGFHC